MNNIDENNDTESNWDSLPDHLKNDLIVQVFKELSIVKGHTRLLVLVTHGFIELLVNALIDHHLKNNKKVTTDSRSYPHSTKLLLLNELGIIDDKEYKVFDWFRKLRNKAAHQPIFNLTKVELGNLEPIKFKDPDNFHSVCIDIIGGFWNQHVPIFGPKFAPGMVADNNDS